MGENYLNYDGLVRYHTKLWDEIESANEVIAAALNDLNSNKENEINPSNKLSADLVDDTNSMHKFVTAQEKTTWNNKSDFSGSYNDLTNKPAIPAAQVLSDWNATSGMGVILNKPTIPTVPTNVSAFTNDAGYLTQHQDISGKENITTIIAPVNTTDATLPVTSLTCEIGKYYRLDVPVETLAVTLPAMTNLTTVRTVVIYLTGGTTPAITISAADSKDVYYQNGYEIEAGKTYEINALFNGAAWIVAVVEIVTSIPFFCKLTLNNGTVVELESSGELTQSMISSYQPTLVSAKIGTLCTSIGGYAFYDFYQMTSITIPDSVTSISDYAFCMCSSLDTASRNAISAINPSALNCGGGADI